MMTMDGIITKHSPLPQSYRLAHAFVFTDAHAILCKTQFCGFRAGVLLEPLKGILYPFVSGGGDVETLAAGSRREIWKLEEEIPLLKKIEKFRLNQSLLHL